MKITAVVITLNEEKNIGRCLSSLESISEEIIVVDSFSTDKTEIICNRYGVRFMQNKWSGINDQRNFSLQFASHDYVLSLDADEALSEELKNELIQLKSEGLKYDGYIFNRMTNYCGKKWIRHSGWYPDRKLRLFNKNKGVYKGKDPHDKIVMREDSNVQLVKKDILHYSYHELEDHIDQINKFSTIGAKEADKKGGKKTSVFFHLLIYPFWIFFKNYFFKLGILDGYYGFVVCMNGSYYKFLKYVKLYNLRNTK